MARLTFEDMSYYASSFGMRAIIDRDQVGERDLRILLRGGQPGVAEQFLNGAQIRAVSEQVGRVGVTETVRMHG